MYTLIGAAVLFLVFYLWYSISSRKIQARTERIRKVQRIHGPDAKISYMNVHGKRYTWQISIESVRPRGNDWVITAWCHEKNEFLVFYASRMYEYFDLIRYEEVKNVPEYFNRHFAAKRSRRAA